MATREPIAIVGVTALFPGSLDAAGFWQDIVAGRDLIQEVPAHYWLVEDYYDPDPAAVDKTTANGARSCHRWPSTRWSSACRQRP